MPHGEDIAPARNPVLAGEQMVAASHPAVSLVGARVLADGGNAIDATLAMAAMCWVALPGQCGIGGDAFAVVRDPAGPVWTVGGSGFGPDGGDPVFYAERGLSAIPLQGALSAAAPGAIAALAAMHRRAGTRELAELWLPAITAARRGLPCTGKTRDDIAEHDRALAADGGTRQMFLPRGAVPRIGDRLVYPEFADTLRTLAHDPASLYRGELAERALAMLRAGGAPFDGAEWQLSGTATVGPALTGPYGDLLVHETPLPTPGWMVLHQAALCDGVLGERPPLSAGAVDHMAAAARRAFHDRAQHCGSDTEAWRELLAPAAIAAARSDIVSGRRVTASGVHPDGDTTSTVAVDSDGRAVSFIHSLAFTFGSRTSVPGTGILLNNRLGRGAYLAEGHPNQVKPRRRPLHTLNAWITTDRHARLRHVGNTPGGDGQVQWNMQMLSHLADHGMNPQQAVSAARFSVHPGSDADTLDDADELRCESRIGTDTIDSLRGEGHAVRVLDPWAAGGSALVITADTDRGYLCGGVDPRQDGVVLGG